jgi:hypothetical protein
MEKALDLAESPSRSQIVLPHIYNRTRQHMARKATRLLRYPSLVFPNHLDLTEVLESMSMQLRRRRLKSRLRRHFSVCHAVKRKILHLYFPCRSGSLHQTRRLPALVEYQLVILQFLDNAHHALRRPHKPPCLSTYPTLTKSRPRPILHRPRQHLLHHL